MTSLTSDVRSLRSIWGWTCLKTFDLYDLRGQKCRKTKKLKNWTFSFLELRNENKLCNVWIGIQKVFKPLMGVLLHDELWGLSSSLLKPNRPLYACCPTAVCFWIFDAPLVWFLMKKQKFFPGAKISSVKLSKSLMWLFWLL